MKFPNFFVNIHLPASDLDFVKLFNQATQKLVLYRFFENISKKLSKYYVWEVFIYGSFPHYCLGHGGREKKNYPLCYLNSFGICFIPYEIDMQLCFTSRITRHFPHLSQSKSIPLCHSNYLWKEYNGNAISHEIQHKYDVKFNLKGKKTGYK